MRVATFVSLSLLLAGPAAARTWNVTAADGDPARSESKLLLKIEKSRISVVQKSNNSVLTELNLADVVAIWYDDRTVRHTGREWWEKMDQICKEWCDSKDISLPLTLIAIGGAGYLATMPFEEHRHFVNIQTRWNGSSPDVLTLRTNWFDHFWLMTDLSEATGHKWMNVPYQRAKLFWSWTDRTQTFDSRSYAADVPLLSSDYKVLLWEDGKGRGIVMFFAAHDSGTPVLVAIDSVTVQKSDRVDAGSEYCRGTDDTHRLRTVQIGRKRATLLSSVRSCGPASGRD
jgi:hypothetical protein